MSVAGIEALYAGVCEIENITPDKLLLTQHGNSSFSLEVSGVPMTVVHYSARPENVYLIVTMGPLPEELLLQGCRVLLGANFILQGSDTQVFGRDPDTGDCVLHCAYPLEAITPTDMYQRLVAVAGLTNSWRESYFLSDSQQAPHGGDRAMQEMFGLRA